MQKFDLLIIGAGSAGTAAAQSAYAAEKKVVIAEKSLIGGTCVNDGCIPFKSFFNIAEKIAQVRGGIAGMSAAEIKLDYVQIANEVNRRVENIRKSLEFSLRNIPVLYAEAAIKDKHHAIIGNEEIEFDYLLIAAGSRPAAEISPTAQLLAFTSLPQEITIVGSGAVGIEAASILAKLGVHVTLQEKQNVVSPGIPNILRRELEIMLRREGITIKTNCSEIPENALICSGRSPVLPKFLNNALVPEIGGDGGISVDKNQRTTIENWFAAGDVCSGTPKLAYTASYQAKKAVSVMFNFNSQSEIAPDFVPYCIFAPSPLAWFGDLDNPNYTIERKSYKTIPAATAFDDTRGFVITAADKNGRLVGAAVCGTAAHELIHQLLICAEYKITQEDFHRKVLTLHPVLSELL